MNPYGGDWIFNSRCWKDRPDPEIFFPETLEALEYAKNYCSSCPVASECIEFCNRNDIRGVAGGKNYITRKREEISQRRYLKALQERMQELLPGVKGPNAA